MTTLWRDSRITDLPQNENDVATSKRNKRLVMGLSTAVLTKASGLFFQMVVLTVIIRSLGATNFTLYAMLAATLSLVQFANLGLGPRLVTSVAKAAALNDERAEQQLLTSALIPLALLAIALYVIALLATTWLPTALYGSKIVRQHTGLTGYLNIIIGLALLQCVLSITDLFQAGYQLQYVINIRGTIANVFSAVCVAFVAHCCPNVLAYLMAVYAVPILLLFANTVYLFIRHIHILPKVSCFSFSLARKLIRSGLFFSFTAGVGNYLNHQVPIILAGRTLAASASASFAAALNLFLSAFGLISVVGSLFWPAIADCVANKHYQWLVRVYRRVFMITVLFGVLGFLGFTFFGAAILKLWLGKEVQTAHTLMFFCGLYFLFDSFEYLHYTILIGLGDIRIPSMVYLLRSVVAFILMLLFGSRFEGAGAFIALSIAVVFVSAWPLYALTNARIAALANV